MKKLLLNLITVCICFFSQAQTYHSFVHDTAIWNEVRYSLFCCDPPSGNALVYGINIIMMNDTSFNNFNWKKIYFQQISCSSMGNFCPPCFGSGITIPQLRGFAREDSTKKVFFVAYDFSVLPVQCSIETFNTEKILYDFGLNAGDTVQWKPFNNVVISVDSVQAPNGEYLRRIIFDNTTPDRWIEGLGSEIGFFGSYTPPPFECDCELWCAQANDLLLPGSPPPCGGIVTGIPGVQNQDRLLLFPNPSSDNISISSPFQSSSTLTVINSEGEMIFKKQLLPIEKISLSKNELPSSGLFFFRLIAEDGRSQTGTEIYLNRSTPKK